MYRLLATILFITSFPVFYIFLSIKDTTMWFQYGRVMTTAETEVFTEKITPICTKISTCIYVSLFVYFKFFKR